jgi:hypothetical protein
MSADDQRVPSHLDYVKPIPIEELDGQVPARATGSDARWDVRALAAALDHPKRNGLLMIAIGFVVPMTSMVMGIVTGSFFPAAIPIGTAIMCAGAWLVVVPVPVGAKERLLGQDEVVAGRGWVLWQLGIGTMILVGAAVGIAALFKLQGL